MINGYFTLYGTKGLPKISTVLTGNGKLDLIFWLFPKGNVAH